jgi:hypothetical protein
VNINNRDFAKNRPKAGWLFLVLQKNIAFVVLAVASTLTFSWLATGQEMHINTAISGQSLDIHLDPSDVGCHASRPIELGRLFCFRLSVTGMNTLQLKDFSLLKFDAVMPEHRHGMVTRPSIKTLAPGKYLIEGLKLHMAGDWKFIMDLKYQKSTSQVAISLKL